MRNSFAASRYKKKVSKGDVIYFETEKLKKSQIRKRQTSRSSQRGESIRMEHPFLDRLISKGLVFTRFVMLIFYGRKELTLYKIDKFIMLYKRCNIISIVKYCLKKFISNNFINIIITNNKILIIKN